MLVLAADLPFLNPENLLEMTILSKHLLQVRIAPDRLRSGTNALLLSPPGVIPFCFGPGSFDLHCEAAALTGAIFTEVNSPSLAFDLDQPEDLQHIQLDNFTRTL